METCPFCRIARKEIGAEIVYDDDLIMAFLDRRPIRPGHTQIIPHAHFPYFEDVPLSTATRMMELGQRLAQRMKELYGVVRVAFVFTGGDVAHAHAHVLPMHEKTDITSRRYIAEAMLTFGGVPQAAPGELKAVAAELRQGLTL